MDAGTSCRCGGKNYTAAGPIAPGAGPLTIALHLLAKIAKQRLHRSELGGFVEKEISPPLAAGDLVLGERVVGEDDDRRRRHRILRAQGGNNAEPAACLEIEVDNGELN